MSRCLLLITLCCFHILSQGQAKTLNAVKASHPPKIDGNINDEVWQEAPLATNFVQNFPTYGATPVANTTVRILYDDDAIYVAAYLYDDPSLIRKQITARDAEQGQNVDYFSVFLDTYNDKQNGFQFLVTSANVQTDVKIGSAIGFGFGDFGDRTWDAVWESQVQHLSDGWTVEMKIPYISIRFSKKEIQTWGLQFLRFFRRTNESDYWNPVNPEVNGFTNQFGTYVDLRNIQPPLRLSFSPYLSGGVRVNPEGSNIKTEWLRNGGMDVKYGVNESFTLDATLIPDFGQVVSDNIVNNLSPFEVRFKENRPFFTEGTELFNKSGLFYSRRIGGIPAGYNAIDQLIALNPSYEVIKNPSVTQLYNGIKFSGRTKKKLGIGIFNAVTAPMKAKISETSINKDTLILTEPMSNYNIIVLDQALRGQSSVTFTNTNVIREGEYRDANVSAFDWALYTKDNNYRVAGTARYSKIFGYTPYSGNEINLIYDTVTRNGIKYVNPYSGYNTSLEFGKVGGRLQYFIRNEITSNTYDPNDLGFILTANQVIYEGGISYNQFTPTRNFITYRYSFDVSTQYLYKPYRFSEVEMNASALWVFKNFWDVTLSVNTYPLDQHDYFELRTPGKFLVRPSEITFGLEGSSDSRKRLFFNYEGNYGLRSAPDNGYNFFLFGLRYRFSDKFTMSTTYSRQYENNQRGYAFLRESNGDPIAGYRNFTESASIVSAIYNFTPRLNLTVRNRHYWNRVHYNRFFNVLDNGDLVEKPASFQPGIDENFNTFNLDAFLTWDFRLGSRVIFGWKNWLGDPNSVDGFTYRNYTENLGQAMKNSHGNELTLKVIYFLDYNQLRKRR
ncbi:MAG: DUF5916 domain-containing protein [Flavisolibacter sp.]